MKLIFVFIFVWFFLSAGVDGEILSACDVDGFEMLRLLGFTEIIVLKPSWAFLFV